MNRSLLPRFAALVLATTLAVGRVLAQTAPDPNTDPAAYDAWKNAQARPAVTSATVPGLAASRARVARAAVAPAWKVPFAYDGTWTALDRGDDNSSDRITLPFNFAFYGSDYDQLYVNNNGNVSFEDAYSSYSPVGFPSSQYRMIAAFWADIDTRAAESGQTWYKIVEEGGYRRFVVHWDSVGYYRQHGDKLSSMQLILSERADDPLLGAGNNVCVVYGDMQFTTGDASGGSDGFGGSAATVGANKGDGTAYFLYGRFDHEGTDYDGPDGAIDGVSQLDGRTLCFNTGASVANVPPIADAASGVIHELQIGETFDQTLSFLSPESGQTTTVMVADGGLGHFAATLTPGNTATARLVFTPTAGEVGDHSILVTATDDGSPSLSTTVEVILRVLPPACGVPSLASEEVDQTNRTVTVTFTSVDRLLRVEFVDPQGNPFLNNFVVAQAPDRFVDDGSGISWMFDGPGDEAPTSAAFVLKATAAHASYFAQVMNGCENVADIDPLHTFALPETFAIEGNFPNPFNPSTTIRFALPQRAAVQLSIFDVTGRQVATLVSGEFEAGTHEAQWNGRDASGLEVASGVYLARLVAGATVQTHRMVLLK